MKNLTKNSTSKNVKKAATKTTSEKVIDLLHSADKKPVAKKEIKLSINAQKNIDDLKGLAVELLASKEKRDHNTAKYVLKMCHESNFELQNFIARYDIKLIDVKRNKWGKMFWLAESILKNKAVSRKAYEQSSYMYDAFFNVFTKSNFNNGQELKFTANDIALRTGEIVDDGSIHGRFKGMEGNTQPYAVMNVLECFTGTARQSKQGQDWKSTSLKIDNSSKFGKVFFKFIAECEQEHINKGANWAKISNA